MIRRIAVLLCSLSVPVSAIAQQPGNYTLFPVTTDLQRLLLRTTTSVDGNEKAVVLIDGPSFIQPDGTIKSTALDLAALRNDLKPYGDRAKGVVFFRLYQATSSEGNLAAELMHYALEGFAQRAGFRRGLVTTTYFGGRYNWQSHIDEVNRKTGSNADADEPIVSNDLVRLAGVRTILSRYLTSNADCVVQVIPPVENSAGEVPPLKVRQAIQGLMAQALFQGRETLLLQFEYRRDGKEALERFIENERRQYAESLGFKDCRVSMSYRP